MATKAQESWLALLEAPGAGYSHVDLAGILIEIGIPAISCRIQMSLFYKVQLIKPGADLNWPLPGENVV